MNKTVELVNYWGEFEEKHPDAKIEDFCRHYLTVSREKNNTRELFDGATPEDSAATLGKLIVWIDRLGMIYRNKALENIDIKQFEEFILLNAVSSLKEPKKTEAINMNMLELSTGLNLLTALEKRGYLTEHEDEFDKRSKRLRITEKGRIKLNECYEQLTRVSKMLFADMTEEDIELCILLLKNVEGKFSPLWIRHKTMKLNEITDEMESLNKAAK